MEPAYKEDWKMKSFSYLKHKWNSHRLIIYGIITIILIESSFCTEITSSTPINDEFVSQIPSAILDQFPGSEAEKLAAYEEYLKLLSDEDPLTLEEFPGSEEEKLAAYEEYLKQYSEEDGLTLEKYNEYLKQISNPDEVSLKAHDYFNDHWHPEEITFDVPSNELPSFQESFQSIFFEDWISRPSYSLQADEEQDEETITFEDEDTQVIIKKVYDDEDELTETTILSDDTEVYERIFQSGNQTITETTTYTGQPCIRLIEPDLSDLDDIQIPIRSQEGGMGAASSETITTSIEIKIGFEYDLPVINYDLNIALGIIRFRFWAHFECGYHFVFPVRLEIEFPKEVYEGQKYSLKCKLIPLNLPDYNEFELKFIFDVGSSIDVNIPELKWVKVWRKVWRWCKCGHRRRKWRKVWREVPRLRWTDHWHSIVKVPVVDLFFHEYASYMTPMSGEKIKIPFTLELDLLPILAQLGIPYVSQICDALSNFLMLGFGLGNLYVYGDSITGKLAVSAGSIISSSNDVGWTSSGEARSLTFGVPDADEKYLSISISNMVFHTKKVELAPTFFIRGKKIDFLFFEINLARWIDWSVEIGKIYLGQWNIPTRKTYQISGPSVIPAEALDFAMDIKEVTPYKGQGSLAGITSNDQMFEITLQNLGGRIDTIELDAFGLPEGYTATFDRAIPEYKVGPTPTTVSLLVSPPVHIVEPPGERTFSISATSLGREDQGLPNATVSKTATITIPNIVDFSLSIDDEEVDVIQVTPGSYIPINFYGRNFGNLNDTINVNATLYSADIIQTWESSYSVDAYEGGFDQYYDGQFDFTYSKADLFPSPGIYTLDIQAQSQRNPLITKNSRLFLNFTAFYEVETSITPSSTTVLANWETNFTFTLTNTGNSWDNFTLVSEGWDYYLIFSNTILNVGPMEMNNVTVTLRISDPTEVPSKVYNFRIVAMSDGSRASVFSAAEVNVTILPAEYVPPDIEYLGSPKIGGLTYPQSPLSLGPVWEAFDEYPKDYTVYIDGLEYITDTWQNEAPVMVPVVGPINELTVGQHNITIIFRDESNNEASDQVWVNIAPSDTLKPMIVTISDPLTLPVNFSYPHFIAWNCTEEYLLNVTLSANGTVIPYTEFFLEQEANDTDIYTAKSIIRVGSLGVGVWNFTLTMQDMGNNNESSSILVTITPADGYVPNVNLPSPETSGYLGRNETISLTVTDANPDRYEFRVNSILEYNESWQSDVPIEFMVDELELVVGDNDLNIHLSDLAGNLFDYQWTYNLIDTDAPTILKSPTDFTVYEHNYTAIEVPYWEIHDFDARPGQFTIYRDGEIINEGNWTAANPIVYLPLSNLSRGIYHFQAEIRDASGNPVTSTVEVTVLDGLSPYIWPHDPIRFEPIFTASWFEFYVSELHLDSYQLYKNGTLVDSGPFATDFPFLLVDIIDLPPGYYEYSMIATDEAGNAGQETVQVYVTDHTPPFIRRPADIYYSEGTTGHIIHWEILEAYPKNFSLYCDSELIDSGTLTEMNMTTKADDLELGAHEYVLIVYDDQGWSHSSSCYVIVVDITAPSITHIADTQFIVGDPYAELLWEVTDLHPDSYSIFRNNIFLVENSWTGAEITYSVKNWPAGTHNLKIIVKDTSGNEAIDEVQVNLIEEETEITTRKPPKASSPGFELIIAIAILVGVKITTQIKKRRKK